MNMYALASTLRRLAAGSAASHLQLRCCDSERHFLFTTRHERLDPVVVRALVGAEARISGFPFRGRIPGTPCDALVLFVNLETLISRFSFSNARRRVPAARRLVRCAPQHI